MISSISAGNISCNGGSDGTALANVTGGMTPYNYSWDDPNNQTDSMATGLSAGTYMVIVTGSDSCSATGYITLTEPSALVLTSNSTNANCGTNDGSASVNATGGMPPYQYLWDDSLAQTTATANNLYAGVYNVIVTDSNGCTT
ncbi:MAG TPA: hypothetical protein EYN89_05570, partial [Flavobacteriales bacterium]|nr:hypothetical protein [Flavobacteriales bacterium]